MVGTELILVSLVALVVEGLHLSGVDIGILFALHHVDVGFPTAGEVADDGERHVVVASLLCLNRQFVRGEIGGEGQRVNAQLWEGVCVVAFCRQLILVPVVVGAELILVSLRECLEAFHHKRVDVLVFFAPGHQHIGLGLVGGPSASEFTHDGVIVDVLSDAGGHECGKVSVIAHDIAFDIDNHAVGQVFTYLAKHILDLKTLFTHLLYGQGVRCLL